MTTITLDHVTKTFSRSAPTDDRRIAALDNVSLKIASGVVLAVIGPSGCGKSTLLRLIAGLIAPDSGRVLYDQTLLSEIPLEERGVGMVFQDRALVPIWKARTNIGFHLHLQKREHEVPERMRRISQITGIGIEKLMDRFPGQLSGGEQQRVGIARALARDPRVFLFDEPFSNLDAPLRAQARVELKRLLNEFPVTSVYVTHDQHEAIALAHRIAVLREGKLEQTGTYQHLYHNPINLFVATFVGTPQINLLHGQVRGHQWFGRSFGGYPLRHDLSDGDDVIMGVRPESVVLAGEGVPARVESVTPLYSESQQFLELASNGEQWHVLAPLSPPISIGDEVRCRIEADKTMYFDPRSELRIG